MFSSHTSDPAVTPLADDARRPVRRALVSVYDKTGRAPVADLVSPSNRGTTTLERTRVIRRTAE